MSSLSHTLQKSGYICKDETKLLVPESEEREALLEWIWKKLAPDAVLAGPNGEDRMSSICAQLHIFGISPSLMTGPGQEDMLADAVNLAMESSSQRESQRLKDGSFEKTAENNARLLKLACARKADLCSDNLRLFEVCPELQPKQPEGTSRKSSVPTASLRSDNVKAELDALAAQIDTLRQKSEDQANEGADESSTACSEALAGQLERLLEAAGNFQHLFTTDIKPWAKMLPENKGDGIGPLAATANEGYQKLCSVLEALSRLNEAQAALGNRGSGALDAASSADQAAAADLQRSLEVLQSSLGRNLRAISVS